MPYAKINGINLNYEIRGVGPKLLFINGIGADLKNPISQQILHLNMDILIK